jgi:hypothetical protein
MMTTVIHVRDMGRHPGAVFIGREHSGRGRGPSFKRSPWANPWRVEAVGRERAIALYARWIAGDLEVDELVPPGRWHRPTIDQIRDELRGQVLACWCDPLPCHGHVLAAIADDIEHPAAVCRRGTR